MTRSGTGTTDRQCKVNNEMCGLRGGRELTTTQVAKQANTGRTRMYDWTGEVPATVTSYRGGLAFLSLRGAKRRSNLGGEPNEVATPRQVGARNDKDAWCWKTGSYKKLEKRPADAGLFIVFGTDEQHDYFYPRGILHREGAGRSWAITNTSNIPGVD